MSVHLGGGTDIAKAVGYCKELITAPRRTIVVLVSDLCEGGSRQSLYRTCHDIVESGARLIALTALNEHSVPDYDRATAQTLADLGAHVEGNDARTAGGLYGRHHAGIKGGDGYGTATGASGRAAGCGRGNTSLRCATRGP